MRWRSLAPVVALLVLGTVAKAVSVGPDLRILAPSAGFRSGSGNLWLVVAASPTPQTRLDGQVVLGARSVGRGIYHVRLEGLRSEGSKVEIRSGAKVVQLVLFGPGVNESRFHLSPPLACGTCHPADSRSCGGCHRMKGAVHGFPAPDHCSKCHQGQGQLKSAVPGLCFGCHAEYSKGAHPRLRHPVSAVRDPFRPGRPFNCTSCHDPHRSEFLARQRPEERREWCKRCHRK